MAPSLRARYANASLQAKFALHVGLSTGLLFAVLLPLVLYIQRQALLSEVESTGFRLAHVFARSSVPAVVADDYLVMQHVVNGISSDRKVLYAMLLDEHGLVLVHNNALERGKRYGDARSMAAAVTRGPRLERYLAADGTPVYDFAVPVYVLDEKRATARIGVSIEPELAQIARTRNFIVGLGLAVLAGGLAWATYLARRVVRPVRALVEGTRAVAKGDLDHRITVDVGDELGQLAAAFNRMTEDLKRSHAELSAAQKGLVQKTRMATIGEIAAAVAHEIRNPLGAVTNCVQLLRRTAGIPEADRELLEIVHDETQRLNAIVGDFLAFGRPRPPSFEEVDLHELVDEAFARLRRDDRCSSAVVFEKAFDPGGSKIRADRDQLRQVFWNLFLNAVQAMGDAGTLGVESCVLGDRVEIRIRDTGPGIAPAIRARLFEPFVTSKAAGSGLGLPIVRRIIEEHGGLVSVDTPRDGGTCFVLSLGLHGH